MTERVVDNPANHGWTDAGGGKWTWNAGGGTGGGAIEDGTVQGQVTTWDAAKGEWTPDSSLTFDASGNATFSGTVDAFTVGSSTRNCAIRFAEVNGNPTIRPYSITNDALLDGEISLGNAQGRFKDATFSGAIAGGDLDLSAGGITICQNPNSGSAIHKTEPVIEIESAPMHGNNASHTAALVSAAMPAGWGTGELRVQIADGWRSYSSVIALAVGQNGCTAPDFIASSDERLKDNITTAPVGVIDSLKGREWDWSGSGEKGSGVVAQELEQVLPHLVHEDDEGMKSVSYNGLVAYLIEEVKALKAAVEALKNG